MSLVRLFSLFYGAFSVTITIERRMIGSKMIAEVERIWKETVVALPPVLPRGTEENLEKS